MRGASSAPTERVIDVVELLSRSSTGGLRFSDVVRELDLSQATAHSILKTLCDRGWVTRDPVRKTFALGLNLAVIAERMDTLRPLAALAREAIGRLAESVGVPASVVERTGDDLAITAFENPDGYSDTILPHDRIPYAPPFGIACAAWDSIDEQEAWIQRGALGDGPLAERLRAVLAQTRDRGYDVDWMTPALAQAAHAIGSLSGETVPRNLRAVIDQLRVEFISANLLSDDGPPGAHPIATISAPVLDDTDRVRLILGIHPLRHMTSREIRSAAKPLLREIARISRERTASAVRS
ncbi:helix-turn-helix domain-containing protein [Mycobacterium sp. 1274761.0]|uniref:helix-turn-helix domain-containing protein n=1 Tax=Mycobacterium sp. 1274761.0 TaxID=1834077 RepID=UPI0008008EFC|nr:helix-turn-helix domain-containing protein [Mycobacterium sp. 1274761.0]OBK71713.1 transcriptional regulator [Mycobacterium sp. 1274761.0]